MEAYRKLEERYRRLADIGGALGVLHWDRASGMPDGGAEARAAQIATSALAARQLHLPTLEISFMPISLDILPPPMQSNQRAGRKPDLCPGDYTPADIQVNR